MQLEVGKTYYSRNGTIFKVVRKIDNPNDNWPYEGYDIDRDSYWGCWRADGTSNHDLGVPDGEDLTQEIPPSPPKRAPKAYIDAVKVHALLNEVMAERAAQEAKWGQQNHGPAAWLPILIEEVGEVGRAMCEANAAMSLEDDEVYTNHMANYREELIQTAAVCLAMVECLDRNK